jgi:uncharacterized protein involved in response to NO
VDPYRVFFPLGIVFSVWGTLLWILFAFQMGDYPGVTHPMIMGGGFLLCFASGFLMTAIPKFTGTEACTKEELSTALIPPALLAMTLIFKVESPYGYLAVGMGYLNLIYFAAKRIMRRKNNPFPEFIFVGFGIFSGLSGSIFGMLGSDPALTKQLIYVVPFFFMIVGVGSRLSTALLGHTPDSRLPWKLYLIESTLLLIFTFLRWYHFQHSIELIILLQSAILNWKLWRLPLNKGYLPWSVWFSCISFLLGNLSILLFQNFYIHGVHLTFIGGFALMCLSVATRVSLAHGNYLLIFEKKDHRILITYALVLLSAATRISAPLMSKHYISHLAYASFVWIAAVGVWSFFMFPKIFRVNKIHPTEIFNQNPFLKKQEMKPTIGAPL